MKIFRNKSLFKKIIFILLFLIIISFCIPKQVKAISPGTLMDPVMSLFVGLGDGVMTLLQKVVFGIDNSIVEIDTSTAWWEYALYGLAIIGIGIASVCAIAGAIATGGALAIALAVGKVVLTAAIAGATMVITYPVVHTIGTGMLGDNVVLPLYNITPQEIFSNKIPLLDVNFFSDEDRTLVIDQNGKTIVNPSEADKADKKNTVMESTATLLRPTIAGWYLILRNIAVVALLSILVYTGIRILLTSASADKAKYKQMLIDWIVAMCLLFIMQYIMTFANIIVEKIIYIVDTSRVDISTGKDQNIVQPESFIISIDDVVEEAYTALVKDPTEQGKYTSEEKSTYYQYFRDADVDKDGNVNSIGGPGGKDSDVLMWPAENFMQQARLEAQFLKDDEPTYVSIGWKLIFVVLVVYTVIFLFTYVKRVIYMAFLTIISPLVAMTYPIDKMSDGKAQAFDMWIKEYIFNLLIQPMHLILYTVLVGSAMEFASKNIFYVVVALGFMTPAEKLLRRFFGFEKAQTPGLLAGPAGAAMMMSGVNKLLGRSKSDSDKKKLQNGGNGASSDSSGKPPKVSKGFNDAQALFGNPNGGNTNNDRRNLSIQGENTSQRQGSSPLLGGGQDGNNDTGNAFEQNEEAWDRFYGSPNAGLGLEEDTNNFNSNGWLYANEALETDWQRKNQGMPQRENAPYYIDGSRENGNLDMYYYPNTESESSSASERPSNPPVQGNIRTNMPEMDDEITTNDSESRTDTRQNETTGQRTQTPQRLQTPPSAQSVRTAQNTNNTQRTSRPERRRVKRHPLRAVGSATRYAFNKKSEQNFEKLKNFHPVKQAAKFAAGAAGAAVLGTAGGIAGIVAGDMSKGAQYTTAGALGGYKLTSGIPDKVEKIVPEGTGEALKDGYYGSSEERAQVEQERYVKQYQRNADNKLALEREFGKKEAKRMMKEDVPQMLDNGVYDIKEVIAIESLIRDKDVRAINNVDQGIAIKKKADRMGNNPKNMKQDDKDKWKNTFRKEYDGKGYDNTETMADITMSAIQSFYDAKS